MIRINRTTPDGQAWLDWIEQAKRAAAKLKRMFDSGAPLVFDEQAYKGAMPFLLELTRGKCAYCECVIELGQPGDVEHYRPKGRVREQDADGKAVFLGGYWWLAYEWRNLLPACADCNRIRMHGDMAEKAGKGDQFGVRGLRASAPGDEEHEKPLLLDPSDAAFNPADHLFFADDGTVRALTEEGAYTCKVLGLNCRERLVQFRKRSFEDANRLLADWVHGVFVSDEARVRNLASRIDEIWEGREQYSAAGKAGLVNAQTLAARRKLSVSFPIGG